MHRFSTILALVCVLPVAVASSGCQRDSAAARDAERERVLQERMAQDETAVRAASAGWSKAAQSKDLEKSLTFFADDAIMISPQSPAVEGFGTVPPHVEAWMRRGLRAFRVYGCFSILLKLY